NGLLGTLKATAMSALFAFPLGGLLALMRLSTRRPLRWLATGYIELFRSIPLLLLIYAFTLALPRYHVNPPDYWKLVIPTVLLPSRPGRGGGAVDRPPCRPPGSRAPATGAATDGGTAPTA